MWTLFIFTIVITVILVVSIVVIIFVLANASDISMTVIPEIIVITLSLLLRRSMTLSLLCMLLTLFY